MNIMKTPKFKNIATISVFSLIACSLYTILLKSSFNQYLYTSIAKLMLFAVIPLIYFALFKDAKFKNLFLIFQPNETDKSTRKKSIKAAAILGAAAFIVILIAFVFMNNLFDKNMILDGLAKENITKSSYPYVFLHIVLINSFLEELFFRGFIFLNMLRLGYKKYACIFSSVLFAVYHVAMFDSWFSPPMFAFCLLGLIVSGLLFNEIDRRCNNIYGGFFIHAAANLAINTIGLYFFYFA